MKINYKILPSIVGMLILILSWQCQTPKNQNKENQSSTSTDSCTMLVEAGSYIDASSTVQKLNTSSNLSYIQTNKKGWLTYKIHVQTTGRYRIKLYAQTADTSKVNCWFEDYIDNKDARCYNITGNMPLQKINSTTGFNTITKEGTPLDTGFHTIKLHFDSGSIMIHKICFQLMKPHKNTPKIYTQQTKGKQWKLVWSDEFNGKGLPDTTKWSYNIGNWGWGNNELQYYTENRLQNARQEDGNLIIEARKNDEGMNWSSARLTTQGKASFLYGKIEFKAKVPQGKGSWAAGWLLGDDYKDELSWPYCGEVDVMENIGLEMDAKTGNGKTHASIHCRAYYFKIGNQKTSIIDVKDMANAFHIYSIEWLPTGMTILLDGKEYLKYTDTTNYFSWPFSKPQNLIVNLAMGGGMGKKVDPSLTSQKLIIDYVRVYALE